MEGIYVSAIQYESLAPAYHTFNLFGNDLRIIGSTAGDFDSA